MVVKYQVQQHQQYPNHRVIIDQLFDSQPNARHPLVRAKIQLSSGCIFCVLWLPNGKRVEFATPKMINDLATLKTIPNAQLSQPSDTVGLAAELIKNASVTPNDEGCQTHIGARLARLGFKIERFDCAGVSNLYARYGTTDPHLTFIGHTDVVPTGELAKWQYPPFSATLADGFLHGRGAADMKGSVAAMVTACERLLMSLSTPLHGSLSFVLTSDEEGPAVDGTRHVLEQLSARGERLPFCLVGEPTSETRLGATPKIGRRGSLTGVITVRGRQGPVAYPHLADNPVHRSGRLIWMLAEQVWPDGGVMFPDRIRRRGCRIRAD